MMDHLTAQDLDELIGVDSGPCVSIYIPTERMGPETRQNPLQLKAALGEASSRLEGRGMRRPEIEAFLEPAADLVDNHDFWQHQEGGLALFIDGDGLRRFRIPIRFDQLVVVGERFHIKPLLPVLSSDGEFYVLALSHNDVRLLRGSRWQVSELELTDVPSSLREALWYRDPETALQYHSTSAGGTAMAFHGHGMGKESSEEELRAFFRHVDKGVTTVVADRQVPVVLSGVGYLLPLYRDITSLNVVEGAVEGNPDELTVDKLHEMAWPLVEEVFEGNLRAARERFENADPAHSATAVEDVIVSAFQGRVASLFVPAGTQRWGNFDPSTLEVTVDGNDHAADLYDLAAAGTWQHRGEVFAVDSAQVPGPGDVAALLRF